MGHFYVVVDGAALVERLMPNHLKSHSQQGREGERRKGKEEGEEKELRRRMRRSAAGGDGNIKGRWLQGLPGCRQMLKGEYNYCKCSFKKFNDNQFIVY